MFDQKLEFDKAPAQNTPLNAGYFYTHVDNFFIVHRLQKVINFSILPVSIRVLSSKYACENNVPHIKFMKTKNQLPEPGSYEFKQECWSDNPKSARHLKFCVSCAKRKADNEHYWKWRVKTRKDAPCSDLVCRQCGWPQDAHKSPLAKK
jgi:hypothetical protein